MDTSSPHVPLDDLWTHAGWVRALARRLVSDPSVADDLAQEAWVAALGAPPRDARNLKGWLARVVHNAARQRARGEARRTRRERARDAERADEGVAPSPAELLERLDLERALAGHVAALAEPYRTTVLLRYHEGWSAAEIARRQGVPAGTVRWRLKTAHDELRARLDAAAGGDRRAWALGLVALLGRDEARRAGAGTLGALAQALLALHVSLKLAFAAATVVAGLVLWRLADPGGPLLPPAVPVAVVSDAELAPPERGPEHEPGRSAADARRPASATAATGPASAGATPAAEVPAAGIRVEARVLDEAGRPLAGAVLRWSDRARATSDAAGRARLERSGVGWGERQLDLVIEAEGRTRERRSVRAGPGDTEWLGDIVLRPAGEVAGRVLDERGRPVAGAWVSFDDEVGSEGSVEAARRSRSDRGRLFSGEARTDAEGRFRLDALPAGPGRAWAGLEGRMAACSAPLEVVAGATVSAGELVLEPVAAQDVIAGRVVDPQGRPVPRALLDLSYRGLFGSGSKSRQCDADGRFRVLLAPRRARTVRASDPEGRWADAVAEKVAPGTLDLVLRLAEPGERVVRVRDALGRPVTSVVLYVQGVSERGARTVESTDERGDHAVRAPAEPFFVRIAADGFAETRLGPLEPAGEPLSCVLEALPGVRGTVTADGAPVAGARVELHVVDGQRWTRDDFRVRFSPEVAVAGETDAEGRFALTVREEGDYVLLCAAAGHALAELGPFVVVPATGVSGLRVELGPGGALEGRVLVDAGAEPAGTIVGVSRGDGRARTQVVGPDGRFRFEGLAPGRWDVRAVEREILEADGSYSSSSWGSAHDEVPWRCTVRAGETTAYDLDLRAGRLPVLVGRLTLDGAAPPVGDGWTAQLVPADVLVYTTDDAAKARLDAEGAFRVQLDEPGRYRLDLAATTAGPEGLRLMQILELPAGATPWSAELTTGSLQLSGCEPAQGAMPTALVLWEQGDLLGFVPVLPGESGIIIAPLVPAGVLRVVGMDPVRFMRDPRTLETIAEVEVAPGARAELELTE